MSIYKKLLEMQKFANGLKKDVKGDGRNTFDHLSGEKLIGVLRPKMNELGLLLKPEVLELEHERQDYKTKFSEKSEILYKAKMVFTWIDTDTGEKDECRFYGTGMNNWEKGFGSCLTYAERYFLMKYFHIPTDKDDVDSRPSLDSVTVVPIKPNQLKQINILISQIGVDTKKVEDKKKLYDWLKITSLKEISESKANEIIKKLKETKKQKEKK